MKLLTKQIEKKFEKFPLYSQDGKGMDAELVVKFFLPVGAATWLITEGNKLDNGDYELYGYCTLNGSDWEWGYVMLSELQKIRVWGSLGVERDLYASGTVGKNI